jgi:hypothetical protein
VTCTTDADCPRLACGPCTAGEVVTREHMRIKCFRNPCPGEVSTCQHGVCAATGSGQR